MALANPVPASAAKSKTDRVVFDATLACLLAETPLPLINRGAYH